MQEVYENEELTLQLRKTLEAAEAFQKNSQEKLDAAVSILFDAWNADEAEEFFKKADIISGSIKALSKEICCLCEELNRNFCGR